MFAWKQYPKKRSRGGLLAALALSAICLLILSGYILAWAGPVWDRARAHQLLRTDKSIEELREAVQPLGRVFTFPDGSWIAIRYTDSHTNPGYSCAVALDSRGEWFYSKRHFCGRFRIFGMIQRQTKEMLVSSGGATATEVSAKLRKLDAELYDLAQAPALSAARDQLLKIGFSPPN